ncbi:MAG TPA: hypothetical protein VMY37_29715 [Thermoguttaceae bacterium]|nr:hypothetical protein [Thermoguttaceae bacterium]
MRRFIAVGLALLAAAGCAVNPPVTNPVWETTNVFQNNPVLLPVRDHELAWETVVDVVDDYFRIEQEEPVRLVGNVVTEGRLDTFPAVGSTMFEPWRRDSANPYEKLESTLQSIRRHATVRVSPAQGGYLVDVAVFKELEDVVQPMHATAGAATFRNDSSLTRVVSAVGEQEIHEDWIPMGRDTALEQRIIQQLMARAGVGAPVWGPATGPPIQTLGPQVAPPGVLPLPCPPATDPPGSQPTGTWQPGGGPG